MLLSRREIARRLALALAFGILISRVEGQDAAGFNEAERMLQLNMVELESQLVSGLRLTTRDQKAYIARVIEAVKQERIPRSMVNVVYVWSLEKHAKYPFPYFRIALQVLASRRGISLD